MKKLLELVFNDQVPKEENLKVRELINLLGYSKNEKDFAIFLNEFEDIGKRLSVEKMDRTQELLEYICIEVDHLKKNGQASKTNVIKKVKFIHVFLISFLHRPKHN